MIKYVWHVDFPAGTRDAYLDWTKSIASALQEPSEPRRIRSYENYLGGSPNRVVEFEFDDTESAGRYFDRPALRAVFEELISRGSRVSVTVLKQRGDYTKG
jgi:hypothetical protein